MQQRRLRLGDILDDYCPRERRITNHAVVAMLDERVQQTRCTTCDADHEYKEGKSPTLRRKKPAGALSTGLLDDGRPRAADVVASAGVVEELTLDSVDDVAVSHPMLAGDSVSLAGIENVIDEDALPEEPAFNDDGPVHRRLIRATLPRPEGQTPERKAPDFTMRQPTGRDPGNQRGGQQRRGPRPVRQAGQPGGNFSDAQPRFGGPRPRAGQGQGQGQPNGQRQGNRPGPPGQRGGRPGGPNNGPRPPGAGGGQGRRRGR
jgi:hypothetical protein